MHDSISRTSLTMAVAALLAVAAAAHATEVPEEWQSMTPDQLVALANELQAGGDETADQRALLVSYLADTFSVDPTGADGFTVGQASDLTRAIGQEVAADVKDAWAQELRNSYAPNPQAAGQLSTDDMLSLAATLRRLGDSEQESAQMVNAWTVQSDAWHTAQPDELATLGEWSNVAQEAGAAARDRLLQRLRTTYLTSADAARPIGPNSWMALTWSLRQYISDDERAAWAEKLRGAYAPESLSLAEFIDLRNAFEYLDFQPFEDVAEGWVTSSSAWQGMTPDQLAWLVRGLATPGGAGRAARARIAAYVAENYLATSESAGSVSAKSLERFSRLRNELSAEDRQLWIASIRQAFMASAAQLGSIPPADYVRKARALENLGDEAVGQLTVSWMENNPSWTTITPEDIVNLAKSLRGKSDGELAAKGQLLTHVRQTYLPDAAPGGAVTCRQWNYFTWLLRDAMSKTVAADWGDKLKAAFVDNAGAYAALKGEGLFPLTETMMMLGRPQTAQQLAARAHDLSCGGQPAPAVDPTTLRHVAWSIKISGAAETDHDFQPYANSLVQLASAGKLGAVLQSSSDHEILAAPLNTTETLTTVRAALTEADGTPRLDVAHVLSWAYARRGAMGDWVDFLDATVAQQSSADAKALWQLARAFAGGFSPIDRRFKAKRCLQPAQEALAKAESGGARLTCTLSVAKLLKEAGKHDRATELLATAATSLTDPKAQRQLAVATEEVRLDRIERLRREAAQFADRACLLERKAAAAAAGGDQNRSALYLKQAQMCRARQAELLARAG